MNKHVVQCECDSIVDVLTSEKGSGVVEPHATQGHFRDLPWLRKDIVQVQ